METVKCDYCGIELPKTDAFFWEDENCFVCPDCKEEHLTECERCGAVIDIDNAYKGFSGHLCDICHDDLFG